MTLRKTERRETLIDGVRRHALALLDKAGTEIPYLGGLRVRHLCTGRFTIIEFGPAEWHVGKDCWSLDVYRRGERIYSAQWHKPNPLDHFCDGFVCSLFSRTDNDMWALELLRMSPPVKAAAGEAV